MSDHLKKIEEELLPEIEQAALKGNINRIVAAVRQSIVELVEHAKLGNLAVSDLAVTGQIRVGDSAGSAEELSEAPKTKKPAQKAAKKAPAKKTAE